MTAPDGDTSRFSRLTSIAALRALRYRNFRLFFLGQSISLIGTWMQIVAMSWLVYRLTGSALMLGVIGFCGQLPTLIITPIAGVLADRWVRRTMLIVTQTLAMIQALLVATLVLTGVAAVWQLIPLAIFLGCVNAFDVPTRQSLFADMVEDRDLLSNAIALNSTIVNSARLIGPTIAGLVIGVAGEGICFLVNGLSYIAVIAALAAMATTPHHAGREHDSILASLREGFRYAFGFPPVRAILMLLAVISLMGMPYSVLMPVFAEKILHGGPHTLGFLMGAAGFGALAGAAYLASRASVFGLGRRVAAAAGLFGVGLIAFSLSRVTWLSIGCLAVVGFGMLISLAGCNTILQSIVDDDKRGRLMSFYTMSFMGVIPFGSLLAGTLANRIGAPATVGMGGVVCIVAATVFATRLRAMRELIRPIYTEKRIYPPAGA